MRAKTTSPPRPSRSGFAGIRSPSCWIRQEDPGRSVPRFRSLTGLPIWHGIGRLWHTLEPAVSYGAFRLDRGSHLSTEYGPDYEDQRTLRIVVVFDPLCSRQSAAHKRSMPPSAARSADISGSSLAGVQVTAVNEETGEKRRTLSGPDGEFTLSVLPPGSYRLEAELPGFRKYVGRGISLQVGQDLRVNISLQPGGPAEEIIVTVTQDLVKPDAMNMGAVIENRQIVNFPLDGRNFLQLALLLPGTAPAAQGSPGFDSRGILGECQRRPRGLQQLRSGRRLQQRSRSSTPSPSIRRWMRFASSKFSPAPTTPPSDAAAAPR